MTALDEFRERNGLQPVELDSTRTVAESVFAANRKDFNGPALGRIAEEEGKLRIGPDKALWRYSDGVYLDDGREWLDRFVRVTLGDEFRIHRLNEVRAWCMANTEEHLSAVPPTDVINLKNGILHWTEDPPRLEAHSPEAASYIQVPIDWDPAASCPQVLKFLRSVLPEEDIDGHLTFLMEWLGHLLDPSNRYKKALMLVGTWNTGKSTLLQLAESFVGQANVSNNTLHTIADDRFGGADLFGKLLNSSADLDAKTVRSASVFKMITGDDTIRVERKYRDAFRWKPYTKLMFSANEAPGTTDQSDAYYGRWCILPMTRQVPEAELDLDLPKRMTTPEELSGLLVMAVASLRVLRGRKRFDVPAAMSDALEDYKQRTDTVRGFADDRLVLEPDEHTPSSSIYEDYKSWCIETKRGALGNRRFIEHLGDVFPMIEYKRRYGGRPHWKGIRLARPGDDV